MADDKRGLEIQEAWWQRGVQDSRSSLRNQSFDPVDEISSKIYRLAKYLLRYTERSAASKITKRSPLVATDDLRIHPWLALRRCGGGPLGVMDGGRAAWDQDKPRTLGHRGNSVRLRRIVFVPGP